MSHYQQMIRETLARTGHLGAAQPRHIEAWMRLEHSTLDNLDMRAFTDEVLIALDCVNADFNASEQLAQSFGL